MRQSKRAGSLVMILRKFGFTPYNPQSLSLQIEDRGNFKSKDKKTPSFRAGIYGVYR
jgi:hypothetical protein